jgi:orotidine-5'-phosphate decarboxylase
VDHRLIVALDTSDRERALVLVDALLPAISTFKVGLQLFTACGPAILGDLAAVNARIFLDLKLHDIPNTVEGAISSVLQHRAVRYLTVHTSGGRSMLEAAARAAQAAGSRRPAILGVTVLTSLDGRELAETGVPRDPDDQVRRLATLGRHCGVDGLVCSPHEVADLRRELGPGFLLVTPGVRPAGGDPGDQKRVATPQAALSAGASHLVVGRPITASPSPLEAARRILESLP